MPFMAAMGIAQLAAPFLGKLFGGGAPTFDDLGSNTKDTSNMTNNALKQAQDLRGDFISKSRDLEGIDVNNARGIGMFDPSTMGANVAADPDNPWAHLGGFGSQFAGADFGANSIRQSLGREQNAIQMAQQIGALSPSMQLGIEDLLMRGGASAGAGMGQGIGGAIAGLGNQLTTGTGLGALLGGGGAGGGGGGTAQGFGGGGIAQLLGGAPGGGGGNPLAALSQIAGGGGGGPSFGAGPAGAGGGGGFDISPMIQGILQQAGGGNGPR